MSTLGDLIVEHGQWTLGDELPVEFGSAANLNALRDELIELRAKVAGTFVVHACPPVGEGLMPCCGRTPFEIPYTHRIANLGEPTTCQGRPVTIRRGGSE